MICIKYRRQKFNKWVYLWDQWKPLELWDRPWQYWRGNMHQDGGFWNGLKSNITLWSPLLNKVIHWKYRNTYLDIPLPKNHHLRVVKGDDDEARN